MSSIAPPQIPTSPDRAPEGVQWAVTAALSPAEERLRTLIEDIVAGVFNVDPRDMRRPTRGRARIALARQVAMYFAHVGWALSLTDVGRLFGRDRTTVSHACMVVEQRRDTPDFDMAMVLLELIIRTLSAPQPSDEEPPDETRHNWLGHAMVDGH